MKNRVSAITYQKGEDQGIQLTPHWYGGDQWEIQGWMSGLSKEKSLQGKRFKNCDDVILPSVIVSTIKVLSFGEVGKDRDLYLGVEIRNS